MRSLPLFGLSLTSILFPFVVASVYDLPLDCAGRKGENNKECQEPLKNAVTNVIPGRFYVARLPCLDCPTVNSEGTGEEMVENELFFNVSLSKDIRTLYLNDAPIFPNFATVPTPTRIAAPQIAPGLSRADLDNVVDCAREVCADEFCSCINSDYGWYLGKANVDFDYYSYQLESTDTEAEKWEITFDVIGGWDNLASDAVWKANNTSQHMLRIVVEGQEIEEGYPGDKSTGGGSLFENPETEEPIYEYTITRVDLAKRTHTFPASPQRLGVAGSLRRFFGLDIIRSDGHIIYLQSEWDSYGKKGSLRNHIGTIVHDWPWTGIFVIFGSTIGGILVLSLACKLFFVVKEQHELARWDGIDTVWANLRRASESRDEEDVRLLSREERYRDSVGEGSYRDEPDDVQTNKPLPGKPLPEKPLPAVPLIDA
ncbi:hypothetical protein P280DRAFT_396528 [Massarina eburnea CBS 473.64]|uniref:Uncharacterized protein n=1 Tax=Massarina eburnea CBS 473.64 TaxID=1395130 RepID=A0A6A6S3Y6_9PLEO|nr:hypothetical protein P280DRAFT_396528 [Massarina eburnea CBS 473.64]